MLFSRKNTFFIVFIYRQFSLSLVRQNIFLENLDSYKQNVELECLSLGVREVSFHGWQQPTLPANKLM